MARPRQSQSPVDFNRTTRSDQGVIMTSGRAGVVSLIDFIPLLRGDSAAGAITVNVNLGRMPKPLLNAVTANVQAWFVPKSVMPQFNGRIELMHSYQGEQITALGQADRDPPPWSYQGQASATFGDDYPILKQAGLHHPQGWTFQADLIDAFNVVYNFRLESFSSKLTKRKYFTEDPAEATSHPRAFWPVGRFSHMVPDYERALVVGSLDLDVSAGKMPIEGMYRGGSVSGFATDTTMIGPDGENITDPPPNGSTPRHMYTAGSPGGSTSQYWPYAEMAEQTVITSLADIDKARTTQAFAELRALYAGMDSTGFVNEDAIIAEFMQGFNVPDDAMQRPWLLDSRRVVFGMAERFSTSAADLEASVSEGQAQTMLNCNVPVNDDGGVIVVTLEVVPERLDERSKDEWFSADSIDMLPDALRDIQRTEPVDTVLKARLDTAHSDPNGAYGYEPMNTRWNRNHTRLGGAYYQPDPTNPFSEQRSALWLAAPVDPEFTDDHWLCPPNFPHDVFLDTQADAWEATIRHNFTIRGLTQFGDVLNENNDEFADTKGDGE